MNTDHLFYRPYSSAKNQIAITNLLFDKLNYTNVLHIHERKIKKYYTIALEQDFLAYRFQVLKQWIQQNEFYSPTYTINLQKVIKTLNLKKFFNGLENQYVKTIESLNFEMSRIKKEIIVDFELEKNEYALFSVESVDVFQINATNNSKKLIGQNFKLYVTNFGLVATNKIYKIRVSYDESLSFKLTTEGVYWYTKTIDFEFITTDKYLLYSYIKTMIYDIRFKNKKFNWPQGYLHRN